MKKESSKVISSIILGIMVALTLTLHVLGKEWYFIMASIFGGIVVGLIFYDRRLLPQILKKSWQMASEKTKNFVWPRVNWPTISPKKIIKISL